MPIACQHKVNHGPQFCVADCPVNAPCGVFQYHRIEHQNDVPPPDDRMIDIAVLDMNHGWPNLGHDSLVHLIQDASCDTIGVLTQCGFSLRALSYDVRRATVVPEGPGKRFRLYVGTGGPGHLNPYENDGKSFASQGIKEDPSWETPLFRLFDEILRHSESSLLAVCHTFGVMCRWAKIALPSLRGPEKGGKSSGILENVLTPEARNHPWFGRFAEALPDGWKLRIVDNRLFDLIPMSEFPESLTAIGYETTDGGSRGEAITMIEWARDNEGVMPRVFGVNHHPEILDRARQLMILQRKHDRGEVTRTWYEERMEILTRTYPEEDSDRRLAVTSDFTIVAPLRFYLFREIRRRAEAFGFSVDLHENQVLQSHMLPGSLART